MFGLHPLKGNRAGQYSMTLTGNYRLIVEKERSKKGLAGRMGRPVNAINETINGKKAITADMLTIGNILATLCKQWWRRGYGRQNFPADVPPRLRGAALRTTGSVVSRGTQPAPILG